MYKGKRAKERNGLVGKLPYQLPNLYAIGLVEQSINFAIPIVLTKLNFGKLILVKISLKLLPTGGIF